MHGLWLLATREFHVHIRAKNEWLCGLLFYVMVTSLFPITGWSATTNNYAPIVIWIAAFLSMLIVQESLLRQDFKLGWFEIILHSDYSLQTVLFVKIILHWLVHGLPLVLITPLIAVYLDVPLQSIGLITLSLCLGTMALSFMGALGSALTVTLARGGLFVAILILPLTTPILSLGANFGVLCSQGVISLGHLALLAAVVIATMILIPPMVALALKVNFE